MIIVEGTIRMADLDAARPVMGAMIAASRNEAGCIDYAYAIDLLESDLIRVSERWESCAALEAHLQTDHIKAWRETWGGLGITDRSLRFYEAEPEVF